MQQSDPRSFSRRHALSIGGGVAAAALSGRAAWSKEKQQTQAAQDGESDASDELPVDRFQQMLQAEGSFREGVLSIGIGRKDLNVKGPHDLTWKPSWELHHEFYVQSIGQGRAMVNGELALLPDEIEPVIDEILAQGLTFQALHQHFFNLQPQIYHIHLRGKEEPDRLARALRAVVGKTGAPLPQKKPDNPSTPLNKEKLAGIIGGHAELHGDGVVTVAVPRGGRIRLGGVRVRPTLGVMSHISFMPLPGKDGGNASQGTKAAVAPDFAMTAEEVDKLMSVTRKGGFDVHCLYNQETDEHPQLYFSHQLAVGDPEQLAHVVRQALEQTDAQFKHSG